MKTKNILAVLLLVVALSATAQKKIKPSELPQGATAFLDKHFKGIPIEKAKKDAEHGEKGYEVILKDGTEIEFWKDGAWREVDGKGKPIPTAYISAVIVEYVDKNYPNEKITHIDYGHKDVDVDLTNKIDLEFDKSGRFLKGDK
jgi:Putative beta-lactamase-inhibitor-like, PepSY-like